MKKGKYPVFVCVPCGPGWFTPFGEGCPPAVPMTPEIIGISHFSIDDIEDIALLERAWQLEPTGFRVKHFVRQVKDADGQVRVIDMAAIEVPTWEEANKVPGFTPIGDYSGSFYPPPKAGFHPVIGEPDMVGDGEAAARVDVSQAYDDFVPPPYNEDGAFTVSLIPFGQLGNYVFLREDQTKIYAVPYCRNAEPVMVARRRLAKERLETAHV